MPLPDRPTKRAKVNDDETRTSISTPSTNHGGNGPVVVTSSSTVTESTAVVATTTTTVNIKGIMLSFYDSKTEAEATKIMVSLSGGQAVMTAANCQKLCDLQGVSTILYTIQRFKTSTTLVSEALRRLINITGYINDTNNLLIALDFHETLLSLAKTHTKSRQAQANAALLFQNLSYGANPQSKMKLGTDEIIHFMKTTMATFHDVVGIVKCACVYFKTMSEIPELKDRLLENEIVQPLAAVFQNFRKRKGDYANANEFIFHYSKEAMANLMA